ncbi:hypothetical protein Ddye_019919 [Dipteronia dyeriana]|uniref:Uncharacterized protein n=1 Tax=Dipteronia dyeriana TaxID=168575 RepID=A0AAD9TYP4_9ROSI|nr:hypothetical protein Ddye_019919 [Dipteronia dyeriana]
MIQNNVTSPLGYLNVQIRLKPLAKIGLNNSILICLRDGRITDYKESILAIAKTNCSNGPIYFQYYPSFTIALNVDIHKEKCLVVDIQTHNYHFSGGFNPYKLVYKIHYRLLTSGQIPNFRPPQILLGQTICYNESPAVNVMVPKALLWEDISLPDTWLKEKVAPVSTRPPTRSLWNIVTYDNGNLGINFGSRLTLQDSRTEVSDEDFQSARQSLSQSLTRTRSHTGLRRQLRGEFIDSRPSISTQPIL